MAETVGNCRGRLIFRGGKVLDLFMTGIDGAVWSTWWEAALGWQPWFVIHPEIKAQPQIRIDALWRQQHLDLFMTGLDGTVWSTWWEAATGWQGWFFILFTFAWNEGPILNRDPAQIEENDQLEARSPGSPPSAPKQPSLMASSAAYAIGLNTK